MAKASVKVEIGKRKRGQGEKEVVAKNKKEEEGKKYSKKVKKHSNEEEEDSDEVESDEVESNEVSESNLEEKEEKEDADDADDSVEEDSDLEEDVEISDEEEEDDDEEEEEEDDDEDIKAELPKKKKKKQDDGSESFASAFGNIIGSRLKAYDRDAPIMARNKTPMKQLESDKLEAKAKRAILAEKKQLQDKHRIKNLLPSSEEPEKVRRIIDHERKLKKTAQKGVVRLFNAVLSTQVRTTQSINKEQAGQTKKQELFNEMSKEKFLDLVQSGETK